MPLLALSFLTVGWLLITTPFYILGRRRGLDHPWVAVLPLFGIAIVLFESIGKSGWLALLVFVPTVGPLLVFVWTAVEIPSHHGRSRWWTAALIVPIVNVIGYWFYALTLPREQDELAFA
jgi:uncharacterized membrane protein YhaH (DUF805 family)